MSRFTAKLRETIEDEAPMHRLWYQREPEGDHLARLERQVQHLLPLLVAGSQGG